MATFIHPGVYFEEISNNPHGINQVPTSVTIFIGYTEKITKATANDLKMKPIAIKSFMEFTTIFGSNSNARFLYDSVKLFYQNGGEDCFVISAGDYSTVVSLADLESCLNISKSIKAQLLLIPDAVLLPINEFANLQQLILKACADLQDRFCILDTHVATSNPAKDIKDFRFGVGMNNLKWGAAYYPWLVLADNKKIPPSGALAGLFTQVDKQRGVWKAPANVSINGIKDLSVHLTNQDQETMNVDAIAGKSVNAIRIFSGSGILVWGARTLSGIDNEWRYISVRRLCTTFEQSVISGTQWAVFEPNDANTWLKINAAINNYLQQLWRNGALTGTKTDQAFYVKVGLNSTMTVLDITEGRMIVEIGMAVVRPAEFIIIRIAHKMAAR